jgi:membrane protein
MSLPTKKRSIAAIFLRLLVRSFKVMRANDPLRMAGATAFFTTFALPPILIILVQLFSIFFNRRMVNTELIAVVSDTLGKEVAAQIRLTTRGFRGLTHNWFLAMVGFLFLLFVATTLFSVIKNTFNDIWNIQVKEKPGVLFRLGMRARSLAVIFITGFLFLAGVFFESFEELAGTHMDKIWPGGGNFFKGAADELAGIIIVTAWFILLFRYLADARPSWGAAFAGGLLTGLLFSGGKVLLSYAFRHSNILKIYGASGSFVLILLFVFYSSFILYYGACFIRVYSEALRKPIVPLAKAYRYRLEEIL